LEYRTAIARQSVSGRTGILAAGLDGIEKGLQSGARREGNLFEMSRQQALDAGIDLLPSNLGEALDELERDDVLCDALGQNYAKTYLKTKRAEWNEYSDMLAKSVTAWEWKKYLSL
jgi:glutamine synthetase